MLPDQDGSREIAALIEKLDMATAARYVASGEYFWNSGIFMVRASVWLEQLGAAQQTIAEACRAAFATHGRDGDFLRSETCVHRKVHRPWGYYDCIDGGSRFQVKRIVANPGVALSLQKHHHRASQWIVVRGAARVTGGNDVFLISENESAYIPLGMRHPLENPRKVPLETIEVQSEAYLGENDIVRFEDAYGRN